MQLEGCDAVDPADLIPSTYWRLEAMSKTLLRGRVLPHIGAQILSAANVRAELDKLGTQRCIEYMLRILQLTTGLPTA